MNRTGFALAIGLTLISGAARAQTGPMPGGGTTPTGQEEADKPDGVAEAAPKTPGLLPTTPTLPPPKGKRKKLELFELDGYFRMRLDYFKNLNLGFSDDEPGGSPFPRTLGCHDAVIDEDMPGTEGPTSDADRPCEDSVKSTNIRLRLEPTVNVNETTSVHFQVDVLDNLVLGTQPSGNPGQTSPLGAFEDDQDPPEAGKNWATDSIRVKRAWAEVQTPLGIIKFGRQPSHWGLGIYQNSGGEDPINGGYDYDGDYGDDVDRISFSTLIPGTKLRGALAFDWPINGISSGQTDNAARGGQPWDLDDNDDVTQWTLVMSRMDAPSDFADAVDRGELAINYGVYFSYRTQGWDYTGTDIGTAFDPNAFVPRASTMYIPDAWVKLAVGKVLIEAEMVGAVGNIDRVSDLDDPEGSSLDASLRVLTLGGVARASARALDDKLRFGFELGGASGDQYDNDPQGSTHISDATLTPDGSDHTLTRFQLDRDYKVDLILWRELVGAVTNAVYGKPWLSYELTKTIGFKVANVTSFALRPIATPGNDSLYGTEFDADVMYSSSAFSAGLAYGFFVPLAGMDHPADGENMEEDGLGFDYDTNSGNAGNAHTLQMRLVVKF